MGDDAVGGEIRIQIPASKHMSVRKFIPLNKLQSNI